MASEKKPQNLDPEEGGFSPQEDDPLEGYFKPGVLPEDHPGAHALLQAQHELSALSSLFSGSFSSVVIRLLILKEIGARVDEPHWSPRDIAHMFSFIEEVKLNTALIRLKNAGILCWLPEISRYQLSATGRMAIAALGTLLQFSRDEGSDLSYLTSQIAAGQALGEINLEMLEHLLARLAELEDEFERAIVSGSEVRIRKSESKLNSVWTHIEQSLEVMEGIHDKVDYDITAYRLSQKIGQRQSRMLNMAGRFQSELNLIERNKVHIERGLSSGDILRWLQQQSKEDLAGLVHASAIPDPDAGFLLSDIALDVAEDRIFERDIEIGDTSLPGPVEAMETDLHPLEAFDYSRLHGFTAELKKQEGVKCFEDVVLFDSYGTTSYRLSLLTLVGHKVDVDKDNPVRQLIELPLSVEPDPDQTIVTPTSDIIAEMTTGTVVSKTHGTTDPQE